MDALKYPERISEFDLIDFICCEESTLERLASGMPAKLSTRELCRGYIRSCNAGAEELNTFKYQHQAEIYRMDNTTLRQPIQTLLASGRIAKHNKLWREHTAKSGSPLAFTIADRLASVRVEIDIVNKLTHFVLLDVVSDLPIDAATSERLLLRAALAQVAYSTNFHTTKLPQITYCLLTLRQPGDYAVVDIDVPEEYREKVIKAIRRYGEFVMGINKTEPARCKECAYCRQTKQQIKPARFEDICKAKDYDDPLWDWG